MLDGIYVIRTSINKDKMSPEKGIRTYKNLSQVKRAFRAIKGIDIKIRPVHHWSEQKVRTHIFLCMLIY